MNVIFQTDKIFDSLTKEITNSIHENVIFTNEAGIIMASTELGRIGDYHEGATLAMQKKAKIIMTEQMCIELQGVRKGIVTPLFIDEKPIGVLGITGNPKKVAPYVQIVQTMAELFIKGTIDQMTQEQIARNIELFVFDWVYGTVTEEALMERSNFHHIDVQKYKQVILMNTPLIQDLSYNDISLLRTEWDQKNNAIFVRWGQGKLLIVDIARNKQTLSKKVKQFCTQVSSLLGDEIYVGIGQISDYHTLLPSLKQAEKACLVANKDNKIIFEADLRFEMLQYDLDKETKLKFIERTLGPIQTDQVLLNTLQNWLEQDMSIQQTANVLHIHKNTLYYRLEKISTLTKTNLKKIDDVMLLYTGLRFLKEFEVE